MKGAFEKSNRLQGYPQLRHGRGHALQHLHDGASDKEIGGPGLVMLPAALGAGLRQSGLPHLRPTMNLSAVIFRKDWKSAISNPCRSHGTRRTRMALWSAGVALSIRSQEHCGHPEHGQILEEGGGNPRSGKEGTHGGGQQREPDEHEKSASSMMESQSLSGDRAKGALRQRSDHASWSTSKGTAFE